MNSFKMEDNRKKEESKKRPKKDVRHFFTLAFRRTQVILIWHKNQDIFSKQTGFMCLSNYTSIDPR